jgi:hypothetical protein
MPKFTLIAEHTDIYGKPTSHKVTHEFNVDTLGDVLENTDLFLRGVGFVPTGTLDYVQDDFQDDYADFGGGSTLEDYPEVQADLMKSNYYFDTERNK